MVRDLRKGGKYWFESNIGVKINLAFVVEIGNCFQWKLIDCVYGKIWMHTYFAKFEQLIRQNNVPKRRADCGFDSRQRHKIKELIK